jgi:type II secretory pathway component GspD/PulD (secretin)
MKKWFSLISFFFITCFGVLAAESGIVWKSVNNSGVILSTNSAKTLAEMLDELIKKFALHPEKIRIDSSVKGLPEVEEIRSQNPENVLNLLLSRHDLTLVPQQGQHLIVLRTEAWRHRPFKKILNAPVSLENILREISQVGQITLHFNTEKIKERKVIRNLDYSTIEDAIFDLARRQNALAVYYPGQHVLVWTQDPPLVTKSFTLRIASQKQVRSFMAKIRIELEEIRLIHDAYPADNLLVLRGSEESVKLALQLIEQWENGLPDISSTDSELFPAPAEIDEKDSEQELLPESRIVRLPLKYLSVGAQTVRSNGQSLIIPGVEESLRKALQQRLEDETEIPPFRPQIIADLLGNTLILEGSKSHVEWMERLVMIWDRPLPLIRIEAHLFETSETHSRQLGLEFRGKSVSTAGTVSVTDQGAYTAGLALGPAAASQALRVDAVLRLLQSEGKGRMLSRPVVVTLNNVEAEMNSGSVLHIKIVTEKTSRLQELKTGITLRVTPRLIEDNDNHSNDRIWLNIYAETSNPTEGSSIDGIPPINTQRAQTQVIVKDGQPFLLGGLIKNSSGQSQSGVPFFKDLPLLGPFFRTSGASDRFDHVMVFVTPTRVFADEIQQLPQFTEKASVKKSAEIKP